MFSVSPAILLACSLLLKSVSTPKVALQPLGDVDSNLLREVADHLRCSAVVDVTVLPEENLPEAAYAAPRQRYRAEALLAFLDSRTPSMYSRVIGITRNDIGAPKGEIPDWGVLGVAELSGRPGVVSTHRLKSRGASDTLARKRLENVVLHELGHTLGLAHCTTKGCVMQDADGSIAPVDESSGHFCAACAARLVWQLSPIPAPVPLPASPER
jgi:archaemetzincin